MNKILAAVTLSLLASTAGAADSMWSSEIEVGAVITTGNTEERNLKLRTNAVADAERFKHTANFDALNSSKDDEKTAQKIYMDYQLDYKLEGDYHSLFGRVSYENDQFSGYAYQTDFTVGYDRELYNNTTHKVNAAIGAGFRRSELETGGSEDEAIIRLAGKYTWEISENSRFRQSLSSEIGEESTISRSESSVTSNIAGNLAMKLSLAVKHQTDVPAGQKETDTETSVTLVYKL